MATEFASVSVTTGGVLLSSSAAGDGDGHTVQFTPPGAIAVGPSGLTYATAYALTTGVEYTYDLPPGSPLYGYSASGTVVVPVLRTGV